ncbi:hypothetical protein [Leucobacter sp. cx-169]|uniref:hypothetical protein n=1 Tax=Leucobacter sp. cx-169 TaxID=2770549 RepID=UPI00165D8B26|nr:hypothetical protein [Leucobacter sp. cx-169]MBC9927316.1 hypothetical protein [Leucobacter sp. cx-169]
MSTIARERAGSVKAGSKVGGQFASLIRSESGSVPHRTPAGQEAAVLESMALHQISGMTCAGDSERLYLVTVQGEHRQEITRLSELPDCEQELAYPEIAEHLLDCAELQRLENIDQRSLDSRTRAMLTGDIAVLTERTEAFTRTSRWSDENLLMVNSNHSEEWKSQGASEKYQVFVRRENGSVTVTQTMTAPLRGVSAATAREYRPEIEEWLAGHFEGDVRLGLNGPAPAFEAVRAAKMDSECVTSESISANGGEAEAGTLHSMGTGVSSYDPELLLGHLQNHESVDQREFVEIRSAWIESKDPAADVRRIGVKNMQPEHWAAAFERARAEGPHQLISGGEHDKHRSAINLLNDFAHRGKISNRVKLAAEIRRQGTVFGAAPMLREVSLMLATRLEEGPLWDRPAPESD